MKGEIYYTVKYKYRLNSHHIADIRFDNVEIAGWYQYNGLGKSYCERAIYVYREAHVQLLKMGI